MADVPRQIEFNIDTAGLGPIHCGSLKVKALSELQCLRKRHVPAPRDFTCLLLRHSPVAARRPLSHVLVDVSVHPDDVHRGVGQVLARLGASLVGLPALSLPRTPRPAGSHPNRDPHHPFCQVVGPSGGGLGTLWAKHADH